MQENGNVNGNNTSKRSKILNNSRIIRFRYERQWEIVGRERGRQSEREWRKKRESNII